MKFQLPDVSDPRSLKPGCLESFVSGGTSKRLTTTPSLNDSIVDARAKSMFFYVKEWDI